MVEEPQQVLVLVSSLRGAMRSKSILVLLFVLAAQLWNQAEAELLLFGGTGHDEFLGCLDCGEYASESVCNDYGTYGNQYSSDSIWNAYSNFGNQYGSNSPWNSYSSSKGVPVLVDRQGNFYGYFTINRYRSDAVDFSDDLLELHETLDGDLEKVRDALCDGF